jgi:hypothetical protein
MGWRRFRRFLPSVEMTRLGEMTTADEMAETVGMAETADMVGTVEMIGPMRIILLPNRRGSQVDLILEGDFGLVPIEIKYGQTVTGRELRGIRDLIKEHGCHAAMGSPSTMIANTSL